MREQMIAGGESAASSDRPSAETDALEVGKSRWRLERSSATGERYRHTLESCMAAMASAVGADGCMGFQLAAAARRPVTTALIRGGESAHLDFLRGTVIGRDPKPTRSWEPDLPDPYEHSHTVTYRHRLRPPHPHDYEAFRDKLLAHGLHDHARRLLYDGRRFLGAVTVERTMDRPLFTRSELARLDEVANGWIPQDRRCRGARRRACPDDVRHALRSRWPLSARLAAGRRLGHAEPPQAPRGRGHRTRPKP